MNEQILEFIKEALDGVCYTYSDETHDNKPKAVLDSLEAQAWQRQKDSFGDKVFREMPYKKGALRVTVVLTKQNELRLDLREWYTPEGS
jgi:hypothetical protein